MEENFTLKPVKYNCFVLDTKFLNVNLPNKY